VGWAGLIAAVALAGKPITPESIDMALALRDLMPICARRHVQRHCCHLHGHTIIVARACIGRSVTACGDEASGQLAPASWPSRCFRLGPPVEAALAAQLIT